MRRTSATVTWIARDVPGAGRTYSLSLGAQAECRVHRRSFAAGKRTIVVIESWTVDD
jgi:hypothetical protein